MCICQVGLDWEFGDGQAGPVDGVLEVGKRGGILPGLVRLDARYTFPAIWHLTYFVPPKKENDTLYKMGGPTPVLYKI